MITILLSRSLAILTICCLIPNIYGVFSPINPLSYDDSSTRIKRQEPKNDEKRANGTCIAPPQPANGQWIFLGSNLTGVPGQIVDKLSIISVTCNDGYILSIQEWPYLMICLNEGKWHSEMPQCKKQCPPVTSTSTLSVICKDINTREIVSCEKASDKTVLHYACLPYYESEIVSSPIHCIDGSWTSPIPRCTPVCGQKHVEASPLIIDGKLATRGNYPWTAAIYSNQGQPANIYINICGGSLITPSLILTAAHCVSSALTGKAYNTSYYQITVGKYYREYKDARDDGTAQYSKVERIVIQPEYRGEIQNMRSDIAILKLVSPFIISIAVQPICFAGLTSFHSGLSGGVITGWNKASDVVKELDVSYSNDHQTCSTQFNNELFLKYFTNDKLCSKYIVEQENALCRGFSGAGMAVKHPQTGRYYIYGVVSIVPRDKSDPSDLCTKNKNLLGTSVAYYDEWISYNIYSLSRSNNQ